MSKKIEVELTEAQARVIRDLLINTTDPINFEGEYGYDLKTACVELYFSKKEVGVMARVFKKINKELLR